MDFLPYQYEQEHLFVNATVAIPMLGFPLAANATRIMDAKCVAGFSRLIGAVRADQNGQAFVEQSNDGTNWDISSASNIVGGTTLIINQLMYLKICRVRIANGGVAQASFRGNLVARPL